MVVSQNLEESIKRSKVAAGWRTTDAVLAFPLFCLAFTSLEIADDPTAGGNAWFFRSLACLTLFVFLAFRFGFRVRGPVLGLGMTCAVYFFAVNLLEFTTFAVIGSAFILSAVLMAGSGQPSWRGLLDVLIKSYIVFNLIGLIIAGVIYTVSGTIIDLHSVIFPFSSARVGLFMGQIRLTGFQIEPGTYSNAMFACVVLRALSTGVIADRLNAVAILSTLVTLAAWAVVGVAAFCAAAFIEIFYARRSINIVSRIALVVLAIILLGAVVVVGFPMSGDNSLTDYFVDRFSGGEGKGSREYKDEALDALWQAVSWRMLFGSPLPYSYCSWCVSPQDLGTFLNMFYYFGIVPTSVVLIAFAWSVWSRRGIAFAVLITPLFVTKFYFYDPVIWLIFGSAIFARPLQKTSTRMVQ